MKKYALPFLLGVVLSLACIAVLISPWWHLFMSPTKNAHCLPIEYSEYPFDNAEYANNDVAPYMPFVVRTETSLQTIKEFYDKNLVLAPRGNSSEEAHWVRNEVRPGEFLYQCGGRLNWEEAERGCIYLRERDGQTVVESIWLYSASAAPVCEAYMSELPFQR